MPVVSGAGTRINNLSSGKKVLLLGLVFEALISPGRPPEPLKITNCSGPVLFQDCLFRPPAQSLLTGDLTAVDVNSSLAVTFVRSQLEGIYAILQSGGNGLRITDSNVHLYDCLVKGGAGGTTLFIPLALAGGSGVQMFGGILFASGSTIQGGQGGDFLGAGCADGADGGIGLHLVSGSPTVHLVDTLVQGGAGGTATPPCLPGSAGADQVIASGSVFVRAVNRQAVAHHADADPRW